MPKSVLMMNDSSTEGIFLREIAFFFLPRKINEGVSWLKELQSVLVSLAMLWHGP